MIVEHNGQQLRLCDFCNPTDDEKDATPEQVIEHLADMMTDTAKLEALMMIHGPERGRRRYLEVGGTVHLTRDDLA